MNLSAFKDEPRLLVEVDLEPLQGARFQPTGFPDLGAADYAAADGTRMLLVESHQSMANRLEAVCWDEAKNDWVPALAGLPYVAVDGRSGLLTTSVLEAHRLNSPYIVGAKDGAGAKGGTFLDRLKNELGVEKKGRVDHDKFLAALLKYDVSSLLHGTFLEKVGGRYRLTRALSSFVEAKNVNIAPGGGVKRDDLSPTGKEVNPKGTAAEGFGHVPFHRDEYTGELTAYFSLDLDQIRGFRLGEQVEQLLISLSLFKIRQVLRRGLRFRTACDLQAKSEPRVTRPESFRLPELSELEKGLPGLIQECSAHFADPVVTRVKYEI